MSGMLREAVILAGGFGTRLKDVVDDVPKPLAPVRGKPFLAYLLEWLARRGFGHTVISVGYRADLIRARFGDKFGDMSLDYAFENEPLGTGGGIANALPLTNSELIWTFNGDTLCDLDTDEMQRLFAVSDADAVIALKEVEDVARYGSISIGEDASVRNFLEKGGTKGEGLINAGVYLLRRDLFKKMSLSGSFSIERDCFQAYTGQIRLFGYRTDAYFIDIGIPDDFHKAQIEFERFDH